MSVTHARAYVQRLLRERDAPAELPIALGCEICAAVGQREWVAKRRAGAVELIGRQGLDNPEIRFKLLELSSELCDVCRGYPEQAEAAATQARALFVTAILPPESAPRLSLG